MEFVALDKLIDDLYREKNKILSKKLEQYSLGNGQFQILNEIAWNDGISQEKISEIRMINKSATAKSVKRLIDKGYIFKERDEKDKRAYCLHCTEKGKQMIPKIRDIVNARESLLSKNIDEKEIKLFKALCQKMYGNLREQLK